MKPLHGTLNNCNVDNEEGVLTAKSEFHNLIQTEITKNKGYICIGLKFFCRWCPFRYFERPWKVRVHQLLYHKKDKRYTPSGTQQLTIASALYDHDIFSSGVPSGNYLQRSAAIMRTQVDPLGPNVNSIPRGLVKRACFAGGMRIVNCDATDGCLPFRQITTHMFASKCFYNLVFQEMLLCKGYFGKMRDQMQVHMTRAGSDLVCLLPTRTDWWMRICEDMLSSAQVTNIERRLLQRLHETSEMAHAQFDATVKIVMNIKGQGNFRMNKKKRASQALPEENALYWIGCMRGTTGAVRIVKPIRSESAEEWVVEDTSVIALQHISV